MRKVLMASALAGVLSLPAGLSLAADPQAAIYGNQFMTQQERDEYRARMRAAKTNEERERIRKEHHERMMEHASAQGSTLPAHPPDTGKGMRPGGGMGMDAGGRRSR